MKIISVIAVLSAALLGEKMESSAVQVPDNMALIPAGSFDMGNPFSTFYPITHPASVSEFYMDKYEVTMALWNQVYEWAINHGYSFDNTGTGKAANHPVYGINWYDMVKWCNARSEKEGYEPSYYTDTTRITLYKTGNIDIKNEWVKWDAGYRLPTETEWERAARGGLSGKRFPWGDTISHSQANYYSAAVLNYDISPTRGFHPEFKKEPYPYTSPVGYFPPNNYGLYDIAGNVWELCWDWYSESYTRLAEEKDYRGPDAGNKKSLRGGSFNGDAWGNGVGFRNGDGPYTMAYQQVGFRAVLSAKAVAFKPPTLGPIQVIETQTVQPVYGICPLRENIKDSLVIVTHGWIPKKDGQTAPPNPDWVDDMVKAIRKNLESRGLKNWQVEPYKWTNAAWTTKLEVLTKLLDNADKEGVNLGNSLTNRGWKHVHFIGHSAGAAVIQTASILVKENNLATTIHTTFLDAYVGFKYGGRSKYGLASDWSDSYFARDPETFDSLFSRTAGYLDYAYGVDITWLEPNKKTIAVYRSANGITGMVPCLYTVTTHGWPHEFYLKTIPPETTTGAELFGFPLSKEGGNWDFATKIYPVEVKSAYIKILGRPDSDCPALGENRVPTYSGPRVDLDKVQTVTSTTGIIKNNGSGLIITSGGKLQQLSLQGIRKNAPTTSDSAWLATSIIVTNTVNFISFDAQFLSVKAEGLLTTYWQTNTIGSIDERVVLPGLQHYTYALPPTVTNSSYTLGFRLDSFSNTVSSIAITNVVFGFIGLREPFSLKVTGTDTNSSPVFSLTGPSGYNYRVDSSTNLVDWSTIAILVNTNGVVHFTDPGSTNTNRRFYRAVTP